MATDLAKIEVTAVDRATAVLSNIKGSVDGVTKSADGLKKAFGAGMFESFSRGPMLAAVGVLGAMSAAAVGAGAYFVSLAKDVASAQAALKGLAESSGASVEWLSSIRGVAKLAGTDLETVAGGMTKLAKSIELGGGDAERALKAIGLSLKDLQGLRTDEQFDKVARALGNYADGAGKTAAAQMLLGKSGAQMLPFMKDYVEFGELSVKTTAAQAKEADELEKNIKRLTMAKEAWKKVVGGELVPVLSDVVSALVRLQTESNGTLDTAKKFAAEGSIKGWAESAVDAIAFLIDAARVLGTVIKVVGQAFVAAGADMAAGIAQGLSAMTGFHPQMQAYANAAREMAASMRQGFSESLDSALNMDASKIQNAIQRSREVGNMLRRAASGEFDDARDRASSSKLAIVGLDEKDVAKAKDNIAQLAKELDALRLKLNNKDVELAKEFELLAKAMKAGLITVKEMSEMQAKAILQSKTYKAEMEYLVAVQKRWNELDEEWFQGEERKRAAIDDTIRSIREQTEQAREELSLLGLSNVERAVAIAQRRAEKTGVDTLTDSYRKFIAEFRQTLYEKEAQEETLKNLEETRRQAESVWRGISDDISRWIMSGFRNTRDLLKRMFETLVLRPLIAPIIGNLTGGLQGIIGGLFGGGAGGAGSILGSLLSGGGLLGAFGASASGAASNVIASLFGGGFGEAIGSTIAGVTGGISGMMGGSILSGLGQMLGALGPVGAVVSGIAALVSRFARDEKGFKFDNSLRNIAAPPANVQQAALGAFAPSGDVDSKILGAIQPFIAKVQGLDKYIADNLLTDKTLAEVRERIQAMQNPRWWNLEDPQAIEKASKYFLQQRYGAAFESINADVAATIKGFSGTADELLAFIQGFIAMRQAINDATDAAHRAAESTAQDVADVLAAQQNNVLASYRAQLRVTQQLLDVAPDSANALGALVTGMQSFRSATIQLLAQIETVRANLATMFGDTIRSIQMSTMDAEQQYAFLQSEADRLFARALTSNDAAEIERLAQRINADVNQAYGLLSADQRAVLAPEQIARLQEVNRLLDERLSQLGGAARDQLSDTMAALAAKLEDVAAAQLEAASRQQTAADTQLDAARTPKEVDVRVNFTANVPGTAEVGG